MFVPYVSPILARVSRRVRGAPAELPTAPTARLVAPRESNWAAPAQMLEDDWSRVLGVMSDTTLALERMRLAGGSREHGATRLFRVGAAKLRGGTVYAGRGYLPVNEGGRPLDVRAEPIRLERALLVSSAAGERYFAHWLLETLCAELLATEAELTPLAVFPLTPRPHEGDYRALLGLADPKHLAADVQELWIADDAHLNTHRRTRLEDMRRRLRAGLGLDADDTRADGPPIFLKRGAGGARRHLVNEPELAGRAEALGMRVLAADTTPVAELLTAFARAPFVLGVEGSGLAHAALSLPRSAHLVVLQPPRRFNNIFKDYADALGLGYSTTVADPGRGDGFRIEWERVERLLARLATRP